MNERMLDLSELSLTDFNRVTAGFEDFKNNTNRERYFGYLDGKEMKKLAKVFGGIYIGPFGTTVITSAILVGGYFAVVKIIEKSRKKKEVVVEVEE